MRALRSRVVAASGAFRALVGPHEARATPARVEPLERRALLSAGDLDLAFGDAGQAFAALGATGGGFVAVAPDGKVVTAAGTWGRSDTHVLLGRFNPDGSVDRSFGTVNGDGGIVAVPRILPAEGVGEFTDQSVTALAVQPDRRIFITGSMADDVALDNGETRRRATFVMRLREDGAPDPTFGGGDGFVLGGEGVATIPSGVAGSSFTGVAVRGDGRILTSRAGSVYRFNADGTPDLSFGAGGAAAVPVPAGGWTFKAADLSLAPGASGDVVVVGSLSPPDGAGGATAFGIARLRPDGSPAPSFGGGDGLAVGPLGDAAAFAGAPARLALAPDGAVVLAGLRGAAEQSRFAVARYTPDGSPDAGFGRGGADGDGVVSVGTPGPNWARGAMDVEVQGDGKVVAVGHTGRAFTVVRLTRAGAPDPAFAAGGADGDGVASVDFAPAEVLGHYDEERTPAFAVALQPDGKVVAAGGQAISDGWGSYGGVSVMRFHGDATAGAPRTYEAERAAITGARVSADHAGFLGTGFVDYVRAGGESVEFTVDAPAAGRYVLGFRYANGGASPRAMGLSVGGTAVPGGVAFAPTGSWRAWVTKGVTVPLAAGANRVVLSATGASGPNLDSLTAQRAAPAVAMTYQAEQAEAVGPTFSSAHPGFTGRGYLDYQHAAGDYIEFVVDAAGPGAYALDFLYANGGATARALELRVDGQVLDEGLSFAPTGAWRNWATVTRTVLLAPGRHTVRLTAVGQSGPNLDALTVTPGAGL